MHQDTTPVAAAPAPAHATGEEDSEVIVWSNGAGDPKSAEAAAQRNPSQKQTAQQAANGKASRDKAARNSWRFNQTGQIVDEAGSHWEIADEIMKLQISDGPRPQQSVEPGSAPPPATSLSQSSRNDSPVATPTSSTGSSPPARIVRHSRDPSYSDTSSSDSSVVTPLHFKTVNTVGTPDRDGETERGISDAELKHLHNLHNGKSDSPGANGSPDFNEFQGHPPYPAIPYASAPQHPVAHHPRPPHLAVVPGYDYRHQVPRTQVQGQQDEVLQVDYNIQSRHYAQPNGNGTASAGNDHRGNSFQSARQEPYRQPQQTHRGSISASYVMNPQHPSMPSAPSVLTSPQSVPAAGFYPNMPGHPLTGHLYDMMMPSQHDPNSAANRATQFRAGHHHSVSDPASLRDATTLALIGNSLHVMQQQHQAQPQHTPPIHSYSQNPGMFPPGSAPVYPNQPFYSPPLMTELDVANALARLPLGYNLGIPGYPPAGLEAQLTGGPSANNRKLGLYKTELCRSWEEKGSCRYGPKCQFAHGEDEIRKVARHPKYKTEICRTFWVSGSCPYGKRCCFIHTELPSAGAPGPPGSGASPEEQRAYQNSVNNGVNGPPPGRTRSMSTGSDPNEPPSSLLARISAKRNEPGENSAPPNGQPNYSRGHSNGNGSLRVDTTSLDNGGGKPNGYPYTSNPALPANGVRSLSDMSGGVSPAPATAGPDFGGRERMDVVGYNQRLGNGGAQVGNSSGHIRHAYNNSESTQRSSGVSSPFEAGARVSPPNGHAHARSDSGNSHHWGAASVPRNQWAPELAAVSTGRYNERTWA